MKSISIALVSAALMTGYFLPQSVKAEPVMKRISCKNTNANNRLRIYENNSSVTKTVTYQIVRDGCRPKANPEGVHYLRFVFAGGGTQSSQVDRPGKFSPAETRTVTSGSFVEIYFLAPLGDRVSGTFDYILTVH